MIVRVCSKKGCWRPIFWWQKDISITLITESDKKIKLNYCSKHGWGVVNEIAGALKGGDDEN
jgi:hypothetical protein